MTRTAIRAALPADRAEILSLLLASALPSEGVDAELDGFVVAEMDGRVVGVAGLERYGRDGLLRSVAVSEGRRGQGVGALLTQRVIADATSRGLEGLYALTTTAESWFPRLGFERIERAQVPEAVQASQEFTTICPSSAAVLRLLLPSPV